MPHAILISGPIGAGKSTLGRAVAEALDAGFVEGDEHAAPDRAWYASALSTSRSILAAGLEALADRPRVVIAYPLNRTNWIFYRRRFADAGVETVVVSLRGAPERLAAPDRYRTFDRAEIARMREMIAQGYDARPFSDLVFDTDRVPFDETARTLAAELARLTQD